MTRENYKDEVMTKLENEKWFRQRSMKNMGIAEIILNKMPELKGGVEEFLQYALTMNNSIDRVWRKILEENPHLRGTDYDDKDMLEGMTLAELAELE